MSATEKGEWWATITHAFQAHVRDEAHFLDAYAELREQVSDPGIRFLIGLILDDERRHHELFDAMASSARGDTGVDPGPPRPRLSGEEAARILDPTERFLEAELEERGHLKDLRKQLKPARDETLWPLLVELFELDTAKHVKILEYVRDRVREARAGA